MHGRVRLVLLAGVTLWLVWIALRPEQPSNAKAAVEQVGLTKAASAGQAMPPASAAPLPSQLARPLLEPARRNPFVLAVAPAPVAPLPKVMPSVLPTIAPTPEAPALNLRFAGRTTAPDGRSTIYAMFGESPIALTVGQNLPNGYRVDAITATAVELSYPTLNTTARLELPPPPPYEIR